MSAATLDFMQQIFMVAGGLGLFLYGMKMMSDGLEDIAGDRMRDILERATSNKVLAILIGAVVTCIIQSSSATTVMVVGFVNASLMTLSQAIGVIMGANIGTTITAQIISLKIDHIAPLIIFVGLIMHMFFKKRRIRNIGFILLGLGILFFGISVMGSPLKDFAGYPQFQAILTTFQNPLMALLAGVAFTAIIQSSSATTGIVVAFYLSGVALPFQTAAFLVLGSNIGTCVTAMLASLAASRESKRAALAHVLFNVIGSGFFGILIIFFPGILVWIQNTWHDGARQVAMFHTLFNLSTTAALVWFIGPLTKLVHKLIPELPSESENTKRLLYLTEHIAQTPSIAASQAHRELCRMGHMALDNLKLSIDAFSSKNSEKADKVFQIEETIDYLNREITAWLVKIQGIEHLSMQDAERLGMMMHTVSDIERIGDHAENIAEYAVEEANDIAKISSVAMEEIKALSKASLMVVTMALDTFENRDETKLEQIEQLEQNVDDLCKQYIENHINRLKSVVCDPRGGVVFTDMISDLERCADHATNIAKSIRMRVSKQ